MTFQTIKLPRVPDMWGDPRYDAYSHRVTFSLIDRATPAYLNGLYNNESINAQALTRSTIFQHLDEIMGDEEWRRSMPNSHSRVMQVYCNSLDWMVISKLKEQNWLLGQINTLESRE